METDLQIFCAMLLRAGVHFRTDSGEGWTTRVKLAGDRCFVFDSDGQLAGIRSEDDCRSYDEGPY